jgi:hypothetical protein
MGIQHSLDVLSAVVEQYESDGRSVRNVEAVAGAVGDGTLEATLTVPVSLAASGSRTTPVPDAATVTERGKLEVEFSTGDLLELPDASGATVEVRERSVHVTDADDLVLTIELTIEPLERTDPAAQRRGADGPTEAEAPDPAPRETAAEDPESAETDPLAAVRDESLPPYEDTVYLRKLYETCGTFAEMSRQIEMDVSSETVRRYMIEADIHDPSSYDTAAAEKRATGTPEEPDTRDVGTDGMSDQRDDPGAGTDETPATASDEGDEHAPATHKETTDGDATASDGPEAENHDPGPVDSPANAVDPRESLAGEQLLTDGIGLPTDLAVEDVADAVVEATTLYEVQQELELGPDRTRNLLRQLNLLDLVLHRVSSPPTRPPSYEMVAARIDQCMAERA